MRIFATTVLVAASLALPAAADDVTDTLQSAIEAYQGGDIKYALEEIVYAQQLLNQMKASALEGFLPDAPEGWTREIDHEQMAGMGMMGGGTGAAAAYSNGSDQFKLTIMADNPMVASMAGIFSNGALLAAQGKLVRVGREKFIQQDNGQLMGVIDNRILVQAEGADSAAMLPVLEKIDFKELGRFGL